MTDISTKVQEAFTENHQPIVEKVIFLQKTFGDIESTKQLLDSFFDGTLILKLEENRKKHDNFYALCSLHFKVANSVEYDDIATTPVKGTKLWMDSVLWLAIHFEVIIYFCQKVDDKFMQYTSSSIMWWLKWVLNVCVEDPRISDKTISHYDALLAYYSEEFDLGKRSVYKTLVSQGIKMARTNMIETHLPTWLEAEKNEFDDCWACQVDDVIRAYCFLKQYDKALEWSEGVLDGSVSCGEVPHATNSLIAEAYFYTGNKQRALELLDNGYPLIKENVSFIRAIAEVMRLYEVMGMVEKAVDIYNDNKKIIKQCESQFQRMLFYIEAVKLPIEDKQECFKEAFSLAMEFSLRDGNIYYCSQLPSVLVS